MRTFPTHTPGLADSTSRPAYWIRSNTENIGM